MNTHTIKISDADLQVIYVALLELKLKDSFNTFVNLKSQIETPQIEERKEVE